MNNSADYQTDLASYNNEIASEFAKGDEKTAAMRGQLERKKDERVANLASKGKDAENALVCADITVNKNMKFLVRTFYNILLNCENYKEKTSNNRNLFLLKYLVQKSNKKTSNYNDLVDYFDKYQAFCFELSLDSVLRGDLNFNYK